MPLQLPNPEVTVKQSCRECKSEIDSYTVKLDNLLLVSKEEIWCAECQAYCPEIREVAGRQDAIAKEQASYPRSVPASPDFPPIPRHSA